MSRNKTLLITDILIYILQCFLMITLEKYTHNKSLYSYFCFSFMYNLLLSFSILKEKKYRLKIIVLNLFFAITVYFFGNINIIKYKEVGQFITSIFFNVILFFFITGNWILSFIIKRISNEKKH